MSQNVFQPTGFGLKIFKQRYAIHENETWEEACRRVASFVSSAEEDGYRVNWEEKFYNEILSNRFIPGGRIIYGSGRRTGSLINCFVIGGTPDMDSRQGWAKYIGDMLIISSLGGGVGMSASTIRPRGTPIHGTGGEATGAVSFMQIVNSVAEEIRGGGGRRAALLFCLDMSHPDLVEFIDKKFIDIDLDFSNPELLSEFITGKLGVFDEETIDAVKKAISKDKDGSFKEAIKFIFKAWLERSLRCANVSVLFDDNPEEFFEKVRNDEMHEFKWKGIIVSEVKARKLWNKIIKNSMHSGEPGILNFYLANKMSNIHSTGPLVSTNPSLRKGSMVLTSEGVVPIEKLVDKTLTVMNYRGEWHPAVAFLSGKNKQLYKVTLQNGVEVFCTKEHKWPVLKKDGSISKKSTPELKRNDKFSIPLKALERPIDNKECVFLKEDGFMLGLKYSSSTKADHKSKGIPKSIWNGSHEFISGFIDGLFGADGYIDEKQKRIVLVTAHEKLASDIKTLLSFYGISCSVKKSGSKSSFPDEKYNPEKEHICYDLQISNLYAKRFSYIFSLTNERKQKVLQSFKSIVSSRKSASTDGYVNVLSVEETDLHEDVYDITVHDDTHTFVVNGVSTGNCGEVTLSPNELCCLGQIVLPRFVSDTGKIDWGKLANTVHIAIRFLDDVLDVTVYPTEEIKAKATSTRRIGLGVTGLHDLLLMCGLKYSSEEGRQLAGKIMKFISNKSYEASAFLAVEKGTYPAFNVQDMETSGFVKTLKPSIRYLVKEKGIRNCAVNSIAPTGCQKPDSLLVTSEGILELQELGDVQGSQWQELNNIQVPQESSEETATRFFNNGIAKTKKIKLKSGIELESTNNHQYRVMEQGNYLWKKADELKAGDRIVVRMGGYNKKSEPDLKTDVSDCVSIKAREINFPGKMTNELAELLGFYFADGSNHKKGVRISCNASQEDYKRVVWLSEKVFNIKPTLERTDRGAISVCLNSVRLLKLLEINGLLKQKSHNISMPRAIRMSSRKSLESFIHGYFCGDGHYELGKFRAWDTTSKKMCQQLLVVLRALGIYAESRVLPKNKGHIGDKEVHRVREFSSFSLTMGDTVKYTRKSFQQDYYDIKNINENLAIDYIESVSESESLTLDIEVPKNNTYIANSVVSHNTVSIVSGVSSGIEPIMGPAYKRMFWVNDIKETEIVVHPLFDKFVNEEKDVDHFEYGEQIDIRNHFEMQAILQQHVDQSISKTIMLSRDTTKKEFSNYMMEYIPKVKGVTVYPVGSRGESPITPLSIEEATAIVKANLGTVGTSEEQAAQDCPKGVCEI
jgi:ribonucleotide reductase alpha subunit